MDRTYQLPELPSLIAMVRQRGQAVRLVVRNAERFGLVHLYFARGHLVHVAGHAGSPSASLGDLATWNYGAIRLDDAGPALGPQGSSIDLDSMLSRALEELLRRGVANPAPPIVAGAPRTGSIGSWSGIHAPAPARRQHAATSGPVVRHGGGPLQGAGPYGLPALPPPSTAPYSAEGPRSLVPPADHLSEPQWQLLGLIVHQIAEQAGHLLGPRMVDIALRQALATQGRSGRFLAALDFDADGWLHVRPPSSAAFFTTEETAEGIASLLTEFETRCADVLGAPRAKHLIASAAAPFRASLEQIGIVISPP